MPGAADPPTAATASGATGKASASTPAAAHCDGAAVRTSSTPAARRTEIAGLGEQARSCRAEQIEAERPREQIGYAGAGQPPDVAVAEAAKRAGGRGGPAAVGACA